MEFKDYLISYRKEHQLSQEQLAELLGVSRPTISRWECGISSPDVNTIQHISAITGISCHELLNIPNPSNVKVELEAKKSVIIGFFVTAFLLFSLIALLVCTSITRIHANKQFPDVSFDAAKYTYSQNTLYCCFILEDYDSSYQYTLLLSDNLGNQITSDISFNNGIGYSNLSIQEDTDYMVIMRVSKNSSYRNHIMSRNLCIKKGEILIQDSSHDASLK